MTLPDIQYSAPFVEGYCSQFFGCRPSPTMNSGGVSFRTVSFRSVPASFRFLSAEFPGNFLGEFWSQGTDFSFAIFPSPLNERTLLFAEQRVPRAIYQKKRSECS